MKRPTLSDIARDAAVSRSAAARVLLGTGGEHVRVSEATRKRIELSADKLQYTPNRLAQQLRGVSSKTIGVILDTLNLQVMSQRLFALEEAARRAGYRLLIGQTHGQMEALQEYAQDFAGRGVEVVLCLFDLAPGRDERVAYCFEDFPKVVMHGRPAWPGGYCVRVDTSTAIRASVDHLIARGKNVCALSLWNSRKDELMSVRQEEFTKRVIEQGGTPIVWDALSEGNAPCPEALSRGIDYMIHQCHANAILASNDIWATRFILHLQRSGYRVPEDVAVIGYDNLDIASVVSPALTTIDQCHEEYARVALKLLLEVSVNSEDSLSFPVRTVTPQLIVREST